MKNSALRTVCPIQLITLRSHLRNLVAHVELPASLVTPPNTQGASPNPPSTNTPSASALSKEAKKKYHLNASTDPLLGELRDLNFSSVGKTLNKHARRLDEDYKVDTYLVWCWSFFSQPCSPSEQVTSENSSSITRLRGEVERPASRSPVITSSWVVFSLSPLWSTFITHIDTGLSEMLVPMTRTEQFNKSLEIQQSEQNSRQQADTLMV